jgi:hypothetical protein
MVEFDRGLIAACGIDCAGCDFRKVPTDAGAAGRIVAWFKKQGWLAQDEGVAEIIERSMYCKGCRGDRAVHWSPNCWILQCCVDGKGLEYCYQCEAFPCDRLEEWATQSPKYEAALGRLERMRAGEM